MARVEAILMQRGSDVIAADAKTTVREAARLMIEARVGSIVIEEKDKVIGIFTERDLMWRVVGERRDPDATLLGEVMSSPVKAVQYTDDVAHCERICRENHIRHLAVEDGEELVGLISLRDLLAAELGVTV